MRRNQRARQRGMAVWTALGLLLTAGCVLQTVHEEIAGIAESDVPRELDKAALPTYRVEPPDILLIEAVNNIRPPDSPLQAGDQLIIRVGNTLPVDPTEDQILQQFKYINGIYLVESNGTIDLGPVYGSVKVAGLTLPEAQKAIDQHLREQIGLSMPQVSVTMPDFSGKQPISGEHLVRPDGTVSLGIYGSVYVAGMTLAEVKQAVEKHLSQYIYNPEVNVDVLAYNSKAYYVITDGGGFGEQVIRLPITGNETVLDAISQIQGLSELSSKDIWIARPAPAGTGVAQIMKVDWQAIAAEGITTTNYQLLPGDRVYIKADRLIALDNFVAKVTAPFERMFGFTLLGHGVVRSLQFGHLQGQRGAGGFGGFGGFGF